MPKQPSNPLEHNTEDLSNAMKAVEKYNQRVDKANSLVCVGLDSDFEYMPKKFLDLEYPQFEFNKEVIERTHEYTSAYKPNVAFYEARGEQGVRELKMTVDYLREHFPDILTICDAKRADIGNTSEQYASSIFDWFGFDAVTLHPYLGHEALQPFLAREDKGCIILCRTSNPGAGEFQDLEVEGKPLWQVVVEHVRDEWNAKGNCMIFMGATYPQELEKARELAPDMTFLTAGVDAQGGDAEKVVRAGLDNKSKGLIINSSRGIIFADDPGGEARKLRDEINKYR